MGFMGIMSFIEFEDKKKYSEVMAGYLTVWIVGSFINTMVLAFSNSNESLSNGRA
jgi:hypothetical protein